MEYIINRIKNLFNNKPLDIGDRVQSLIHGRSGTIIGSGCNGFNVLWDEIKDVDGTFKRYENKTDIKHI